MMILDNIIPTTDRNGIPLKDAVKKAIKRFVEDDLNKYNSILPTTTNVFNNANIDIPEQLKPIIRK
jgi:hypothetical protein